MNTETKRKKVYRLALYGLQASGKTSVLAALAMPRYPHPLGHTCIWRDIEVSTPNEGLNQPSKRLTIQHRSKEWMEQSILKLSQQQLPAPNPSGDDFIFEYDFTASTHQTFHIELVDYSGQLIEPNVSDSDLAKNLRKKLTEMDGILVLADAPFRDGLSQNKNHCAKQAYMDLYHLREAFSLLRCENQACAALDVPVALLITKWDRYSDIDYANPAYEQAKLEEFFNANPSPSHKGLSDVLCFSVTKDNFKVFPVSALGACSCVQLDNGKFVERPKQVNPLNAFGLEDAFIWVAQQRDAIDLQNYQEQAPQNFKKCQKTALDLLNRFPKGSEQAKQINTLLQKCKKAKNARSLYILITIITLWFMAETTIDLVNYRQYKVAANNQHATPEQVDKTEKWLTQYLAAPDFLHLISKVFLSRKKAETLLTELQAHREKSLWVPVEKADENKNFQAAFSLASEYLKYYPYGQHAQKAQNIKLDAETLQLQRKHKEIFRQIAREMKVDRQNADKLRLLLKKLLDIQVVLPEEMRKEQERLENALSNQLRYLEWDRFRKDLAQKMQAGHFLVAAQLLDIRQPEARLNELKETFKMVVIQALEQKVIQAFGEENFKLADKLLKDYAEFPLELQTPEGKNKVAALQRQVDKWQDMALYEAARQHRNAEHILHYLQEAPLQTMAKEVLVYKAYLDNVGPKAILDQLKLKLLQIRWENVDDNDNIVRVFWNDEQVIYNDKVDAKPNTSTGVIGISRVFEAKSDDLISIEITVINEDIFFNDDYGQGVVEKPLSDLANGYGIPLRNGYEVKTGTAFFEIEGYPKAPVLPAWRGEK
jgi:hypothetical protein